MLSKTRGLRLRLALSLALVLAGFSGCPKPAMSPEEAVQPLPVPSPTKPALALTGQAAAKSKAFAWTERPTLEMIPAAPLSGMVHGKPYTAKTAFVTKVRDRLTLVIWDTEPDASGMMPGWGMVELSLRLPEGQPGQIIKALTDKEDPDRTGHATFYFPLDADGNINVNVRWAAAVQISEWEMTPDREHPYLVGPIKGKLALCFDDQKKSWIAGTFEAVENISTYSD